MSRSNKNGDGRGDTAVLTPMVQFAPDWLENVMPKGVWRGLSGDLIKVEEFLDGDEQVIRAEVPGVDPEKDIDVTVQDDSLRIRIERSDRSENKDKDHYRSEFRYGSFTRRVPLPSGADPDKVTASYRDGILEVRLPIDAERAGARKIAIQR